MKTIRDLNLQSKKVLIRCDFNVPIKDSKILDDTRIKKSIETIKYAIDNGARVILLSHLGRISEKRDLSNNSLEPVSKRLSELLEKKVIFIDKTRGKKLEDAINKLEDGDVLLMENTRFEDLNGKLESSNDAELSKYWASLGDIFINDAFGLVHRAHASNVGIASHLPHAVGFLIEKELSVLSELDKPKHPFVVILGGAKVKDKIGVVKNIVKKADYILIGGGMAFTFLVSEDFNTGNSIVDAENISFCQEILEKYPEKILLPIDIVVSNEFKDSYKNKIRAINEIEDAEIGLDIGPKTIKLYEKYLKNAKIVFWNGPLGVYEFKNYKIGTNKILNYLVDKNIKTILGGGDIVAASAQENLKDKVYYASTGGGATLEYIEGSILPGIEAMK